MKTQRRCRPCKKQLPLRLLRTPHPPPHSPPPPPPPPLPHHSAPRIPHSALLLICLLTLSTSAANSTLSDQDLTKITFDQNLNQQISLSLPFRDEHGAPIQLSSCFDQKPVILLLGYYGCPLL